MPHKPVLLKEALRALDLQPGDIVLDGTLGAAGHAQAMLQAIGTTGQFIGLDQDPAALSGARAWLQNSKNISLHHANFRNADSVMDSLNLKHFNAVILDVGYSSDQLEDSGRGFSFNRPGPLDMRMNPEASQTARDLLRDLSQRDLEMLFRTYGQERQARKFAALICRARQKKQIETTQELTAVLGGRPGWARRHPATRVFQALRIAVNDELGALEEALPKLWRYLAPAGRMTVITFHSLEDRIVKFFFRDRVRAAEAEAITKKPVLPSKEERKENPRSRSAKLRAVKKL